MIQRRECGLRCFTLHGASHIRLWIFRSGAMIPAITEPGSDREQLTSLARTCSGIGDAIPTVLTMTVVPILGAGSSMADYRIGFKWWALIIAVVFCDF